MSTIFLYDEFISQPEVNLHVIGKQISILFRQLNLYFNRELSDIHISSTELLYLSSLYANDGIPQDDLAQEYTVDKAAVTRTIHLMEKKGLVLRRTDASDKRAKKNLFDGKGPFYGTKAARITSPLDLCHDRGDEHIGDRAFHQTGSYDGRTGETIKSKRNRRRNMKALIIYASVHHGTFYQGHFETPVTL